MVKAVIVQRVMADDEIGWCHQCGTLQLLADAPWLPLPWCPGLDDPLPCCVNCLSGEPWELGVFKVDNENLRGCAAERHETWTPDVCEACDCG